MFYLMDNKLFTIPLSKSLLIWNYAIYSLCFIVLDEVKKLQNHLKLLREEYVKLQKHLAEVERKYQVAAAAAGQSGDNNFVARLLGTVAELFDKETYR